MSSPKELSETLTLVETAEKLAYQYIAIQEDPHRRNLDFHIPNELSERFIKWLLDAYNSDMLKAWYKGDHKFEATRNIAKEIEVKAPDLKAYLEQTLNLVYNSNDVPFTKKDIEHLKVNIKDASHGEGFSAVFFDYEMWPTFIKDAVIELQAKLLKKKQVTSKVKEIPLSNVLPKEITLNDLVSWTCGKETSAIFKDEKDSYEGFNNRAVTILGRHLCDFGKEIIAYHKYLDKRDNDPSFDISDSLNEEHKENEIFALTVYNEAFIYDAGKKQLEVPISVESIIDDAKAFNKIPPEYLALIMAYEDIPYNDLVKLKERYLSRVRGTQRSVSPFIGPRSITINLSAPQDRIRLWHDLIYRWTGWDCDSLFAIAIEDEDKLPVTEDAQIKLPDFRKLIERINARCEVNIPLPVSLFPKNKQELDQAKDQNKQESRQVIESKLIVNDDGSCVKWKKECFTFKLPARLVVKLLYDEHMKGVPWVSGERIFEMLGQLKEPYYPNKVRDIFKGNKAWNTLIISDGRGFYRLCSP